MSRRLPEFLRPHEADALLAAATRPRDRTLILVGLGAGLRCAEITALRVEDIDLADGLIFVRQGKGKKDRYVCTPPFLTAALVGWIGDRRTGWVFPSPVLPGKPISTRAVRLLLARLRAAAGIVRRCHPHTLRHSYSVGLMRSGADLPSISALLGHSSVMVTARTYMHCDTTLLKGVVGRLAPPGPAAAPSVPPPPSTGPSAD